MDIGALNTQTPFSPPPVPPPPEPATPVFGIVPESDDGPTQSLVDLAAAIARGDPFPGLDPGDEAPSDPLEFLLWLITRAIEQRKNLFASLINGVDFTPPNGPDQLAALLGGASPSALAPSGPLGPLGIIRLDQGGDAGPASANSILFAFADARNQLIGNVLNALG